MSLIMVGLIGLFIIIFIVMLVIIITLTILIIKKKKRANEVFNQMGEKELDEVFNDVVLDENEIKTYDRHIEFNDENL
jgi:uncharacterized membrane protein